MSLKKKVVWLPYDMDTAIGINNEGELVFDYQLEDIDTQQSGADVFNGQQSVVWKNIRAAFGAELKAMYKTLRSNGSLSYAVIEQMFEEHQSKWPETIYNEDARFKYIDPFVNDNQDYLGMLLGSKEEQRKWWLYNRFRYIDSKYVAGDAMTDTITIRPYAADDITLTPYADIYATIAWDANITQERASRNASVTLECPYETMNDNVVTIYSASQLASIGDLSDLQIGVINVSNATRLQSLKIGDSDAQYENVNLRSLTLGNNVLLQTLDVRNCSGLGDTTIEGHTQQTVDISGCSIIENVYFDGTNITGVNLPNGGVLKVLKLPETITNLTIINQPSITTFSVDGSDYSNISTLRVENCSSVIPVLDILGDMAANSRVRIIGFTMAVNSTDDVEDFFDYLDTMRGLDENGNNVDTAVVSGTITGLGNITGSWLAEMNARYPNVDIQYEHVTSNLYYYDGETLYYTETITDGGNGTYSGTPSKSSTAQYSYTFAGWSKDSDDNTVDADARTHVVADRNVYACYTATVRTYTVTWKNVDNTTLETDQNVPYGSTPQYNGATPTYQGQTSQGWSPSISTVTGDVTYTATYLPVYTVKFYNGSTVLQTSSVVQGQNASYTGSTPVNSEDSSLAFLGWTRTSGGTTVDSSALNNIQANTNIYAVFEQSVVVEEITDTWDQIIANIDNGTYKTAYKLGNYKPLDLGTEGTIDMQIVAIDEDELADGSGNAPLTFIGMELLNSAHSMNTYDSISGNWEASGMRTYLTETILPTLPSNIKSRLQRVNKTSYCPNDTTGTTVDKLWIPSLREVYGTGRAYQPNYENSGVQYDKVYGLTQDCIKTRNNAADKWWTRSTIGSVSFENVLTDGAFGRLIYRAGYIADAKPNEALGVCLGFCLGLEPETITDSWSTILANSNPSASYSIGDTKYLDLGTEGKQLMEIVAFNEDDKADNSGKAKITWISKYVLKSGRAMKSSNDSSGGWESSIVRSYLKNTIKPLIPQEVRSAIVDVTKVSAIYLNGTFTQDGQTTTDDVWIPSNHELGYGTTFETTGAVYSSKFTNNNSRIKKNQAVGGYAEIWWLRSVYSASKFSSVYETGDSRSSNATSTNTIALGFCTD